MNRDNLLHILMLVAVLAASVDGASANLHSKVCPILEAFIDVLETIAPALVLLVFTYGGVKYISSADDPGGRKQGKSILIHAIIGGIIIIIARFVVGIVFSGWGDQCPGVL